jgi:HSP20 family molecular chaperone IbpA
MPKKRSLFQKLKRSLQFDDDMFEEDENELPSITTTTASYLQKIQYDDNSDSLGQKEPWQNEEEIVGELAVDVYETEDHIIVQSMVAGVKPESLDITIGREIVVIKGKREDTRKITNDKFFIKELYWGMFARTITLSQEVDPDMAEASETLKLTKFDKAKKATIKVKSI